MFWLSAFGQKRVYSNLSDPCQFHLSAIRRKDNNFHFRKFPGYVLTCGKSIHYGHFQVNYSYVGDVLANQLKKFASVSCLANFKTVARTPKCTSNRSSEHHVIIGNANLDFPHKG